MLNNSTTATVGSVRSDTALLRDRYGPDLLALSGLTILFFGFFIAWIAGWSFIYRTADGQLYADLFRQKALWAGSLDNGAINPLHGFANFFLPMGIWLNPVSLPFGYFSETVAGVVSISVSLGFYLIAIYAMARIAGLGALPAFFVAQLAALVEYPPASIGPNLGFAYLLNPNLALIVALFVASWLVIVSLERFQVIDIAWRAVVLFLFMTYIAYLDPLWLVVTGVVAISFFVAALFGPGGRPAIFARLVCGCVVLAALYSLNVLDFLYTLGTLTARQWFPNEIHGEYQTFITAAFYLRTNLGLAVGILILVGCVAAIRSARTPKWLHVAALGGLLQLGVLLITSVIFLYAGINWTLPLPSYFETVSWPFWIMGAMAGWNRIISIVAVSLSKRRGLRINVLRWSIITALVLVTPALGLGRDTLTGIAAIYSGRQLFYSIPYPKNPILDALQETKLTPGSNFRGRTATFAGFGKQAIREGKTEPLSARPEKIDNHTSLFWNEFGTRLTLQHLWRYDMPTLEEYSQLITPVEYWVGSRFLARAGDPQSRNLLVFSLLDTRMLELFGARFIVTDVDLNDPRASHREIHTGVNGLIVNLYELPNANLGQFSPTNITSVESVGAATRLMADPSFDFTEMAVLLQPQTPPENLVRANSAEIMFDRGFLEARVSTNGPAMLVLPIQFSHCLEVSGPGQPRLLRTNLLLTGLLVQQDGDYRITESFGLFTPGCRGEDIAETKAFQFENDHWVSLPPQLQVHAFRKPIPEVTSDIKWRFPELVPIRSALSREDWQTAVDLLNVFVNRYPTLATGYQLRASALRRLGRIDDALSDEEFITTPKPNSGTRGSR